MSALIKRFFISFVEYKLDLSDLSARLQPVDLLPKFSNMITDFQNLFEKDSGDEEPPSPTKAIFEKYKLQKHNKKRSQYKTKQKKRLNCSPIGPM